uniref:Uncharacterized protein n=1 Tax=Strombidium inclinatum TaxID=197538 RepID=A0A7S3N0E8_9SPIT|mmetsp:Transcript_5691/g.9026  ORF Transcript_5691/g.9026 Transcript_5691/m.9026 type:complete len:139 (+) Transcript_5691:1093-1509(+)
MLALESLMEAISEKEACDVRKSSTIKSLNSDRELTQKLSTGKFTMKAMFKSKSSKARQQQAILERIAQREKDIVNWDVVKKYLIIYLAEVAIPEFRQRKVNKYVMAMQNFSMEELENAKKHQMCWGDFFQLTQQYLPK